MCGKGESHKISDSKFESIVLRDYTQKKKSIFMTLKNILFIKFILACYRLTPKIPKGTKYHNMYRIEKLFNQN